MSARGVAFAAGVAGAADTAVFLARRPRLFREAPGRAAGSSLFLGGWLAYSACAGRDAMRGRGGTDTGLIALTLLGANVAMLGVHLRHRIATPRVFLAAALNAVALGASATARSRVR